MGPQDGRTDFMFYYANLCTISGLFASSFLAFLSAGCHFCSSFQFALLQLEELESQRFAGHKEPKQA
jgi:hypothetical protein